MQLQGIFRLVCHALLLMPLAVNAQPDDAAAAGMQPVAAEDSRQPADLQSLAQASQTATATPAATLQAGVSDSAPQYSLPAGVCPVITDYLFQQCQQNPADAMCAPAGAD